MKEKQVSDIPVPYGVDEKMQNVAKDLVISRLQEGFTISDFCTKHSISTKTFYKYKDSEVFEKYVEDLTEILIPKDVLSAVDKFRLKVMHFVDKENMSKDEMTTFYNMFKPIIDASNRMEAEKLGLTVNANSPTTTSNQSVEEKKAKLIGRLMGNKNN